MGKESRNTERQKAMLAIIKENEEFDVIRSCKPVTNPSRGKKII